MNRWLLLSGGFVSAALLTAGLAFGQTATQPKSATECVKGAPKKVEGQVVSVNPEAGTMTVREKNGKTHQFQVSKEMANDMKPGDNIEANLSRESRC
jgi:hypothetical protein